MMKLKNKLLSHSALLHALARRHVPSEYKNDPSGHAHTKWSGSTRSVHSKPPRHVDGFFGSHGSRDNSKAAFDF